MFHEKIAGDSSYFSFQGLEQIPGFVHAVTTRAAGPNSVTTEDAEAPLRVAAGNHEVLSELRLSGGQLRFLRQVHSTRIVECCDWAEAGNRPEADGILLLEPGQFGVIQTADCVPIILVAPERRVCCLLHAGWRGTRGHIARLGVERLRSAAGVDPGEIVAALGPCIQVCCYEVGTEFPADFNQAGHDSVSIFRGRHLDLLSANRLDLEAVGVRKLLNSGRCTSCHSDRFYSYRARQDSGRIWTLAGFRQS